MIIYVSVPLICSQFAYNKEPFFISVLQAVSQRLMAGFVECLESDEAEEGAEKVSGEGQYCDI